jgi:phage tail sheath protein FI
MECDIFDDYKYITGYNGLSSSTGITGDAKALRDAYASVFEEFRVFAQDARKDHMFIADAPLPIFVQGRNTKTIDRTDTNFASNIYWPLRNVYDPINTSYACVYANCARVNDSASSSQVWVPFSGFAANLMARTDTNFQPWFAPAGFNRGNVAGAVDIALYPKQKQRDQLYKINVNPVAFFPAEGFVVYGQKTLQRQPSAFDRINVRRLFINLETLVRNTVKSFIFEPNTLFTRTQVINTITPFFENAKNTQGVYDYLIICDEKNNTPSVIDDNTLVVDIYMKPTRTAEYILVNFYATRTSQDFNEIIA